MFLTLILVTAGFLVVGRVASQDEKRPQELLASLVLFGIALALHLASGESLWVTAGRMAMEVGIGLVLAAGLIARRRGPARPFLVLGAALLAVAVVVFGGRRLLGMDGGPVLLLVELGPDDSIAELAAALEAHDARAEPAFPRIDLSEDEDLAQVFIVTVPARQEESLRRALGLDRENVDHVEENRLIGLGPPIAADMPATRTHPVLENDPLVGEQWALDAIRAHEAHRLLLGITPVRRARVAIVDTGVDAGHEDISAGMAGGPAGTDQHGHGSHCAGIAGGVTNNGLGIASLNWEGRFVEVTAYRALDANGFGTIEQIAQGIIDAARDGADVVSLSLGDRSPVPPKVLADAIAYARRRGAIVVAAAGNADVDAATHTPSNVEGVIAVAALDPSLRKARFSNVNTSLARPIAAPGVNILSLRTGGGYVPMSGTSMATPMVAGLAGVMRSIRPDLTGDEVYRILSETARDVPDAARTGRMIDAEAALRRVVNAG
jgi:thermitase